MERRIRIAVYGTLAALCVGAVAYAGTARISAGKSNPGSQVSSTVPFPLDTKAVLPTTAQGATPANPSATGAAPLYKIDWYSINGGGTISASSPSYKLGASAGQSVAGEASSANYNAGIGFWYGAGGCSCPFLGDPDATGSIDVLDVTAILDRAFSGGPCTTDPGCPIERCDFDGNGSTDVLDVTSVIDYAFSGGPGPANPC